jgi:diguanylate cyclase (GGDEF)-like protein/PAS domain S-box-containing protein
MTITSFAMSMVKAGVPLTVLYDSIDPLLRAAGIGLWQIDLTTRQVWWSTKTREIYGVSADEVIDLSAAMRFYKESDRADVIKAVETAIARGEPWEDMGQTIVNRDGNEVVLRSAGTCLYHEGQPRWLFGLCFDVTRATQAAREHERLGLVFRQMGNPTVMTDRDGKITWVNQAFVDTTGYTLDIALGQSLSDVLHGASTDSNAKREMALCMAEGRTFRGEIVHYTRDGQAYWVDLAITPVRTATGELIGFVAIEIPCAERREAQSAAQNELESRRRTETLLRDILDAVPAYVFAFDGSDRLLLASNMVRNHFPGFGAQIRAGMTIEDVVSAWLSEAGVETAEGGHADPEMIREKSDLIRLGIKGNERRLADGRWLLSSTQRSNSGNLIWARTDITALKTVQLEAAELARRDPLTGLLNRNAFIASLQTLKTSSPPDHRPSTGCMVVIDIDHFKSMNDAYGHQAGDTLLKVIARRMEASATPADLLARLGGDEFALFLDVGSEAEARDRASRLLEACAQEAEMEGIQLQPSVSIGAAMPLDTQLDHETALRNADRALFEAKRSGRGRVVFYSSELAQELTEKHQVAQQLRKALNADRLTIALQPQFNLRHNNLVAFEALARWQEDGQAIEPLKFVAAAEEHGLADQLGKFILRKALLACRTLRTESGVPVRIAVNISNAQILSESFEQDVKAALAETGVPASALELEVTETVFLERSWNRISERLTRLRGLGIRLALDDFGTGHASLSHLGQLVIDAVKMDKSFVAGIGTDHRRELIARTIANLAAGLEIECIAEGIETTQQLEMISKFGCTSAQGYMLGYPMPLEQAIALMKDHRLPSRLPRSAA